MIRILPWNNGQSGYTAFAGEIRIGTCKRVSGWWAVWIKNGDGVRTFRDEAVALRELEAMAKAATGEAKG